MISNYPFEQPQVPLSSKVPKLNLQSIHDPNHLKVSMPKQNENVPQTTRPPNGKPKNPRFRRIEPPNSKALRSSRAKPFTGITKNGDKPFTPEETISRFRTHLSSFEINEIRDFNEIYFIGKNPKQTLTPRNNNGFDDRDHHLKVKAGDHLAYRYEIVHVLGKGAFGQVIQAFDHKTKELVALKVIINTQQMHEQGKIEVSIVQRLNQGDGFENSHIIEGKDFFIFRNHICATFEILGQNLYEYSRSLRFRPLGMGQLRSIAFEMLTGLMYIHDLKVIHADLKPENVLLVPNSTRSVKIIDFGSSCLIGKAKYEYIQSRYYRAPEVILGIPYSTPMDIWSFGCIIAELMMGQPLFPGNDEQEQLDMIMEVFGMPPLRMIRECSRRSEFFDPSGKRKKNVQSHCRGIGSKSLSSVTGIKDRQLIDLLSKCLAWDQNERITALEARNHPFFTAPTKNKIGHKGICFPVLKHVI